MIYEFGVTIWGVEHGSAAYATCPNGRTIILDAGSSDDFSPAAHLTETRGLNRTTKRLDHLIISHPDQDHISDLPRVCQDLYPRTLTRNKTIPEKLAYGPGGPDTDAKETYRDMLNVYQQQVTGELDLTIEANLGGVRCAPRMLDANEYPELGQGGSANNYSIVTVFRYESKAIIFPGDIEDEGMQILMDTTNVMGEIIKAPIRILVALHHGRKAGVCIPFLQQVEPVLTIMSDKWGTETTDYATYERYSTGWPVLDSGKNGITEKKKVVTTKKNIPPILVAMKKDELVVWT